MSSLYERLGGEAAVEACVVMLYDRLMADPALRPYFASLDIAKQVNKQVAFLTMAFGGPSQYSGRDLRTAHAPHVARGMSDREFDLVAEHLEASLVALGVEAPLVAEVMSRVEGTRGDVLGRATGGGEP